MNKNYIKSLINEMFDQNILKSEDDREYIKGLLYEDGYGEELNGNFDEDLEYLKELWEKEGPVLEEEDEPVDETQNIEDVVNNIKIGFNFIPGIGVGFCSNEKDLEAMKNFVRGGMAIQKMIEGMFGFSSTLDSSYHM